MPDIPLQDPLPQSIPEKNSPLLRMLHDEQTRLRSEIKELRQKQQQKEKEDQKFDSDGNDEQNKSDFRQDGGKNKKDESDEDNQKKKDKEEKKLSLKQRVRGWAKERPVGTILIVVGFVILVIAAILLWLHIESYQNTDDAFVDGHTDPITPRISGIVKAVYVENTYRVKRGQLLLELDPRDYLVAFGQARAQEAQADASVRSQAPNVPITETNQMTEVANAHLSVESAMANLIAAQGKYRSALADLQQAEVEHGNASREEERYRRLVAKEEVSRELYDQRQTTEHEVAALVESRREAARAASKAVNEAESSLGQARQQEAEVRRNLPRQISVQNETLAMRQAEAKAAKARADQAQLNLEYTKIYAPEDGIIGDKTVQLGTQVAPGQELMDLTQTNDIWVTANFKETQIRKMHPGQSVTIHVDALSQDFDGYVEAIPGASGAVYSLLPPENATGNYVKVVQRLPVRIRFKDGQRGAERLAPGMSVEPKVWVR
jgi:membrane fusion protein, multidrug efflux system